MSTFARGALALALALVAPGVALVANASNPLVIPAPTATQAGPLTIEDSNAIRHIDSLSVSPDGRHVALFVRQPDAQNNGFRTGWFAIDLRRDGLIALGDGGELGPRVMFTGHTPGAIAVNESQWSPDGKWLAYTLRSDGQVQLWRSRVDGGAQEQLTRNAADVREFAWADDGAELYFSVGTPREEIKASELARSHEGYRYDEDFWQFTDLLAPRLITPLETNLAVWVVNAATKAERLGGNQERDAFKAVQTRRADKLTQSRKALTCTAEECGGSIKDVWPGADGKKLIFWRGEGINDTVNAFYSWNPANGKVASLLRLPDDELRHCQPTQPAHLVCVRENASIPDQLVQLDLRSGRVRVLVEVNPELASRRLGRVERFEWATPELAWNQPGGELAAQYPKRAYGYILYPPDFDPNKKYPVFIDPYVANGFEPLGAEHPLHVYAASGIVVLRTAFPFPGQRMSMKQMYSAELGFPHLTMLMESSLRALDAVIARGFIDERRVGIGGVSHGTFVPLYLMQKYDRIAAISISSPSWNSMQHYWGTQKARDTMKSLGLGVDDDWTRSPEDRDFWRQIDIADNIDAIEAPLLMHLAAQETYGLVRFISNLSEAQRPYDAYVFREETHIKWQPAHLRSITARNLDWFRFWLQDHEDAAPEKREQYQRWRQLRELQCKNPRTLREYCKK